MAEQEKKGTIYQQINQMLNLDISGSQDQTPLITNINTTATPAKQSKIIIKGNTPEEVYRKGLELEQKKELQNKFFRTTDRGFQRSLQFEAARLPAYIDYESMEYYPIISSALDLFMEESTTIGLNGKMLNIYSNKERIKSLLDEFFYDIVNVNVNLPFWTRNLVKYGDNFALLYGERKKGVIHVKQMVNYEIERFERIQNGKPIVKFKERMTGDEFNTFEIAHFRLLGDDKFLPYGSCLLSDSYIKTSTGKKQIKDIVKGDVVIGFDINTQKKIESTVLDTVHSGIKNVFRISTKHNYIDSSKEHKLLIYDRNINDFKYEFVENLKIGDGVIINNSDINCIDKNIDKTEIFTIDRLKREFHYYQNIDCIPNKMTTEFAKFFGFMYGDGWISHNKDVSFALGEYDTQNLEYINLLEKFSGVKPRLVKPSIETNYKYTQAIVGSKMLSNILKNLGFEGKFNTKKIPDWMFNSSKEIREAFLDGFIDADGSTFIDKWNCVRYSIEINNSTLIKDLKYLVQSLGYKSGKITHRERNENKYIKGKKINSTGSYYFYFFKSINKQLKKYDIKNRITNDFIVEPIISIQDIGKGDVYDIHVDNENHNFYANNMVVHNSVLNKIRRVFRQLILSEDAMLTYRIIRAGEKKVFKIDVGNIDEDDIEEYIYKVATKFKKTAQISPNDGQIDYRFNILGNDEDYFLPVRNANTQTGVETLPGACLALDTRIELLDGRSLPLCDIINEYESGKKLWSYSINPQTGEIVPGCITWAGVTRKNTDVVKITLDNGESITCTPDHKFPTKFDGVKEAKDLIIGESMFAFNKKFEKIKSNQKRKKYEKEYEMVYDHLTKNWIFTHKLVSGFMKNQGINNVFNFDEKHIGDNKSVTHHADMNRFNNNPENLVSMSYVDHFKYHSYIGIENMSEADMDERVKKLNEGFFNYYNNLTEEQKITRNKNISKKRKEKLNSLTDEEYEMYINKLTTNLHSEKSLNNLRATMQTDEYREKMRINGIKIRSNPEINERIRRAVVFEYNQEMLNYIVNYVSNNTNRLESFIEHVNNGDNDFKNMFFKLNCNKPYFSSFTQFTRHLILKIIRSFNYKNWSDFCEKVPCFNHKIVSIEFLPNKIDTGTITIDGNEEFHKYHTFATTCGIFTCNSNLSDIADIEYLRDNLFSGLSIPKPFLSFQDASGGGKNMAQFDIRFAKKINRIQQAMIQELNKMAMIHLYLLGYSGEDLSSFTLTLTNPSTQLELQKSELLRDKAQTYTELTRGESGIAAMSHTTAKRVIFNMSDREIVDDLKQQKMEKVVMQELADAPVTIKKTGLFADIDKRFGEPELALLGAPSGGTEGGELPPTGGGGLPKGGGFPSKEGGENIPELGGELGAAAPPAGGAPPTGEMPPLAEGQGKLSQDEFAKYVENMVFGSVPEPEKKKVGRHKKVISENNIINDTLNNRAQDMINEIDDLLKAGSTLNTVSEDKIEDVEELKID